MKELNQTVRDIQRCIQFMPGRLPRQLAWRLSPEDWDTVVKQSRSFRRNTSADAPLPIDSLYLLGVRVFKDPTCPNIEAP